MPSIINPSASPTATPGELVINWTYNPSNPETPPPANINIYYRTTSQITPNSIGNDTDIQDQLAINAYQSTYILTNLTPGQSYYILLSANEQNDNTTYYSSSFQGIPYAGQTTVFVQPSVVNGQITAQFKLGNSSTTVTSISLRTSTNDLIFEAPTNDYADYGVTFRSSNSNSNGNYYYFPTFTPGSLPYGDYIIVITTSSDGGNITTNSVNFAASGGGGVVCFLGNAPVLTPAGYKRIDSLTVGDMVSTTDGRDVAIQRVKHQRILAPSAAVNPYVIPAGVYGATQNLAISPRHCVAVPGRGMVEARELGLRQLSMKAAFDYYNLELPEWDNMIVAGVEVESLAPKKRVVMTAAQFRELVGGRSVDLAKLARIASVRADGSVDVMMTRKTRRM